MHSSLERLTAIGFRLAGHWQLINRVLRLALTPPMPVAVDILYAFTVDGQLTYVGKTKQGLVKRLQGYRSPPTSAERGGSTNINNHRRIVEALQRGAVVEIYILDNLPMQQHGGFALSLAAGLEDALIRELAPLWNNAGVSPAAGSAKAIPLPAATVPRSQPVLTRTQYASAGGGSVPSVDELFDFCRRAPGMSWTTAVRRSVFAVDVDGNALAITPSSSRAARREARESIRSVLERLARTGSYRMSDYQDVSFNASYLLALVQAWQRERAGTTSV